MTSLRRVQVLAAGIVLLAFLLRIVHVLSMRESPFFDEPAMDPLYHVEWARARADGEDFQPGPFFRAPLYPWFLAAIFRLFGDGLLLPRIAQAMLGAATTWLVYRIGRRVFDSLAALLAALLVATNWVLVHFDSELLIETLAVPLYLSGLYLTLGLSKDDRPRRSALAGAAFGLSALVRPNVLLVMPALFLWLVWSRRRELRRRWPRAIAPALAFTAGVLLPILPITAYNCVVANDRVLISTQGGVNLWIGNNPRSDGSSAIVPDTRPGWWEGYRDAIAQAEQSEGRTLLASEVSRHYARRAWKWILGSPGESVPHILWKLRLFLCDAELGNNADERFLAERFSPLVRFLPPSFALLAPLGLVGLLLSLRSRAGERFPLAAFLALYSLSVIAFFVCSRFRVPILPVLAIYAGHAGAVAVGLVRARRWARLAGIVAVAVGLSTVVRSVPREVDRSGSSGLWMLGMAELSRGEPGAALPWLERAVAANPRNWIAHKDLGIALTEVGRHDEAMEHVLEARALSREDTTVLMALVQLHLAGGAPTEALAVTKRLGELRPDLAVVAYDEGRSYYALGQIDLAEAAWRRTLDLEPGHFHAALMLGEVALAAGRAGEAMLWFQSATRSPVATDPALLADVYAGLIRAQRACGDYPAAETTLQEAHARLPPGPGLAHFDSLLRR